MTEIKKSIGDQMADLLQEEPRQYYDVVFFVGPEKIKVEAVKFVLKAASPVFRREFMGNWETATVKEGDGIPLPDYDPEAFELFVHLIIYDKWSVDELKSLDLAFATMLNLLELCRRFKITKGIKNLEEAADPLIQNFTRFMDTQDFLELSQENMETILSSDTIPLDEKEVFECACRWAEHQCKQKNIELTGENFREVLGSCFFEIRFPTMKFETFRKISIFKTNLLTADEKVAIYEFIGLDDDEKIKYDNTLLLFKTNPRRSTNLYGCSVLRLPKQFKIAANQPFACCGNYVSNFFQVNKKILLNGVGFLGPIEGDTRYDVTVRIKRYVSGSYKYDSEILRKQIFARKGKVFHFLFDEPIKIQPSTCPRSWDSFYKIQYSVKGENSVSQYKADNPKDESVQISGVEFTLTSDWYGHPMAELLYKTIE